MVMRSGKRQEIVIYQSESRARLREKMFSFFGYHICSFAETVERTEYAEVAAIVGGSYCARYNFFNSFVIRIEKASQISIKKLNFLPCWELHPTKDEEASRVNLFSSFRI